MFVPKEEVTAMLRMYITRYSKSVPSSRGFQIQWVLSYNALGNSIEKTRNILKAHVVFVIFKKI